MPRSRKTFSNWHPTMLVATWFGCGLSRFAPGTCGSLIAMPFAWALLTIGGAFWLLIASAILFLLGWWVSAVLVRTTDQKDPQFIVVDEVVGQWIALSVVPLNVIWFALAFILFRVADIFKVWPANWIDKMLPGGLGVMADDVVAGVYAAIVILCIRGGFY